MLWRTATVARGSIGAMRGRQRAVVAVGLVVATLLAVPALASADTFRVTQTSDRAGACDTRCALREAVIAANDRVGEDTIRLPRGRYELTIAGIAEDSAAQGDLDVRAPSEKLTLIGAGARRTIIDANRIDRVFNVIGFPNTRFAVRGVTITGGRGQMSYEGAGLELEGGTTTTLTGTKVAGNTTAADTSYDGAGIVVDSGATLTIKRGILKRNSTPTGDGGAIASQGDLTLLKTTVAGNRAGNDGAGISHGGTSLTIRDSTISGNRAGTDPTSGDSDGAGIYFTGGLASITNSTISGNAGPHPSGDGAGIYVANTTAIDILNTTIAFNEAGDSGGGIYVVGSAAADLTNTVIARNRAPASPGSENCAGTAPLSGGHNLENGTSCALAGAGDLNANPKLGRLADNGGPTRTHALRRTSAAVNRGADAQCPARDQRGVRRPQGRRCDIGAFELERRRR